MDEQSPNQRPAFSAPLYAALRQGSKELAQVLPAFPESVRPIEEPGGLGNPTPQMVTDQITANSPAKSYDAMLDGYAARGVHGREQQRDLER